MYEKYFNLLKKNETDLPDEVKKTIGFFSSRNLWFNLSRNEEARSCADAANRRVRLGHKGIPLEDELKSYFGKFINAAGNEQFVVLHCRGHQELDFDKINRCLIAKDGVKKLTNDELAKMFNLDYGLVNPFTLDPRFLRLEVLQVFDQSIKDNHKSPYTMMTNAGDLTWAIEFKPNELIKAIDNSEVNNIITKHYPEKGNKKKYQPKIGILTGNSPESGILLWKKVNQIIRRNLGVNFFGDISLPNILIESIPDMGLSMELDLREDESWAAVKEGIKSLCRKGATIICIPGNTVHYFTPRICELISEYKAKFVSIPEVTLTYLEKNNIKEFALLGTKFVAELDKKWSHFKGLRKFKVETPSEEVIDQLHQLAFMVKQQGITGAGINKMRDILNQNIRLKNVVIALTEISVILDNQKRKSRKGRNYIDTLELLAEAVADEYLSATQS
jgi:aspartate/glutamate racemase